MPRRARGGGATAGVERGAGGALPAGPAAVPVGPVTVVPLVRHDATWRRPPHVHEAVEIGLYVEGTSELWAPGGERLFLRAGDAYVVPVGVSHGAAAGPRGCVIQVAHAADLPEALVRLAVPRGRPVCFPLPRSRWRAFAVHLGHIQRELAVGDAVSTELARAYAAQLLGLVVRHSAPAARPEVGVAVQDSGGAILQRALTLLDSELLATHSPVPGAAAVWKGAGEVSRIAAALSFSPSYLRRVFRRQLGLSPKAYFQRRRLDLAQVFLAHTDLPVAQIAERLGYTTLREFTTAFSRAAGRPPTAWRQAQRAQTIRDLRG